MQRIGCHLSSSKGFLHMGEEAVSIGANTFQFFTRNPRGGAAKPLDAADLAAYRAFAAEHGIGPIIAHAPYTLNACAADEGLRTFARETMLDDLRRLTHLPGNFYNFHPGSHVKQGTEAGIDLIAETLNAVLPEAGETTVLLETMAGKGSEVGSRFEAVSYTHLARKRGRMPLHRSGNSGRNAVRMARLRRCAALPRMRSALLRLATISIHRNTIIGLP